MRAEFAHEQAQTYLRQRNRFAVLAGVLGLTTLVSLGAAVKEEQCEGFTLDEFARLDLSQMDFSEVYAEFTEAARLPDELETSILIQQKIEDYYARSGQ